MSEHNPLNAPPAIVPEKEALTREGLLEKLKDPLFLPTINEIHRALGFYDEGSYRGWKSTEDRYGWTQFKFIADTQASPFFELFTDEYITAFAEYLSSEVQRYLDSGKSHVTILEVGAGNGRLSHFLIEKLDANIRNSVKVIATDSGKDNLKTSFPVENIDYREALKKHQPEIVISSWMPLGVDFTADIRATKSVDEYILIGEAGDGCCGDPWKTWGQEGTSFSDEEEDVASKSKGIAPYLQDNFEYTSLDLGVQISRADDMLGDHSSTISFRRRA